MGKHYGRLWHRTKRSDRSEGAASPVRKIDPASCDTAELVKALKGAAKRRKRPLSGGLKYL